MKFPRHHKPAPHVPFIALADIAWQIIIFFLIASTFSRNEAMKVDLPSTAGGQTAQSDNNVTISAGEQMLLIDGKAIEFSQLQPRIKDMIAGKTTEQGKIVVIVAKDDLSFQRSSDLLYAIQKAGGIPLFSDDAGASGGASSEKGGGK